MLKTSSVYTVRGIGNPASKPEGGKPDEGKTTD
jgi:hypothetical protein